MSEARTPTRDETFAGAFMLTLAKYAEESAVVIDALNRLGQAAVHGELLEYATLARGVEEQFPP